jgi:hypothetical protein
MEENRSVTDILQTAGQGQPSTPDRHLRNRPRRPTLRSSLVYAASKEIPNRFQLCQTISKATRKLHLASTPTENTINRVLVDIAQQAA